MPRYSIVIPTRERHATLKSAIETVLAQRCDDFELVIQDNFSSPATAEVVGSFADPRIRYFRSDRRLAMHDNWEEALSHTTGDYILFIGDDDGLMPDCLERAQPLIEAMQPDVLAWTVHNYYWPNVGDPARRNLLTADVRHGSTLLEGFTYDPFYANISFRYPARPPGTVVFYGPALTKGQYGWRGIRLYTSIYHCLTARRVVDRVRQRCGRYFFDPIPDFSSLAVNSYFAETVLYYARPLTMNGHSGGSNGGVHGSREALNASVAKFLAETGITLQDLLPEGLPPLVSTFTLIYRCFENVRKRAFPDDPDIPNSLQDFILHATSEAHQDAFTTPEECWRWILQVVQQFKLQQLRLQFNKPQPYVRPQGMKSDSFGRPSYIHIDGNTAGIQTIADAVKFAMNFAVDKDYEIPAVRPKPTAEWIAAAEASSLRPGAIKTVSPLDQTSVGGQVEAPAD